MSAEEPEAGIDRSEVRGAAADRKRKRVLASVGLLAVVALGGVAAAALLGSDGPVETQVAEATTSSTTPTTTTTSTEVAPSGPTAPLTGLHPDEADPAALERLNRPALVAKIDNDPVAMPQIGLERADVVIELQVEGISRYMAIVHSQEVVELGPVRSARTSDPDILAMFGRPLVAWSGGNPTVTRIITSTPWIQSFNPDQIEGAFSRDRSRRRPHNLVVDVGALYARADQPPAVPQPMFNYLDAGQDPGGRPVAGFDLRVGKSPIRMVWSAERGGWLRWSNDRPHVDTAGTQHAPTNVVVLETPYGTSAADSQSPEALTIGEGSAWAFTQGRMLEGRWSRTEAGAPWTLVAADGSPMALTPGTTWVELPATGSGPALLGDDVARVLLGG